ncbi:hypothetical protein RCL_jg21721.t1 [Rhizophagus clarus]|uniref:Uncharacterized protein n=1 Tax=Rhizophagus clarus TaxID=94130 RepID=A0A8H3L1E2_9GLOM|nr:hypothetical protein RCL_jg21721.t1 [Rhizophagus clarus]
MRDYNRYERRRGIDGNEKEVKSLVIVYLFPKLNEIDQLNLVLSYNKLCEKKYNDPKSLQVLLRNIIFMKYTNVIVGIKRRY